MQIRIIAFVLSLFLVGCASYDYSRQFVQQGNLLTKQRLDRLKIGMSKEDAAVLMGTSLISPLFNNERWDYAYTWRKKGGPLHVTNVALYFSNQRLVRIEKYNPKK